MGLTDALCNILIESSDTYESFIKLEHDKYDAIIKDDIKRLDEIISKEQAFYLKMKGLEQRRQKITQDMNMQNKTLKEIIEITGDDEKCKLKSAYDTLHKTLSNFKKINLECKTLIEVKLHKINSAMEKHVMAENNYSDSDCKIKNHKSSIISKKI
nr:flagellar protein FlgN [Sedimentibacter sp.]